MEAAPRSDHAPAYAAMVAGSGIRRRIALAASRMTQAADGQDLETALDMAAEARREIERCQARWDQLPAPMRRELPVPARDPHGRAEMIRSLAAARDEVRRLRRDLLAGTRQGVAERLESIARQVADVAAASADRRERLERARATAEARPGGADAQEAGTRALRDLAAGPSQIRAVRGWLRPGHFARPEQGELYAVMRDMADGGLPVDPVTVSWEASRRGIDADPADLAGGTGPLAVASAREVHRHGLLAQVASAGRDIQASADNRRLAPGMLLRSASDRLRQLDCGPQPDGRRQDDWQPRERQPRRRAGSRGRGGSRVMPAPDSRARREYERRRSRQIAYGQWEPWADAAPVREHVLALRQAGASYEAIARAAGVATMTVHRLLHGERRERPRRSGADPCRACGAAARRHPSSSAAMLLPAGMPPGRGGGCGR